MLVRTICLGGGLVGGFAHLGFLKAISNHQPLCLVDTWVGCSIGAFVAMLCAIGYAPDEIYDKCVGLNESVFNFHSTGNILTSFGIDEGEYIRAFLVDMLLDRGLPPGMTLGLLKSQKGKRLIACATNLTQAETTYYTPETHPDRKLVDIVRTSIGFPFLLTATFQGEDILLDGGMRDNFPLQYAMDDFTGRFPERDAALSVVGCNLVSPPPGKISDFMTYLLALAACVLGRYDSSNKDCCVNVPLSHSDAFNFNSPPPVRRKLFQAGYIAGENFITEGMQRRKHRITRRRSI